LIFCLELGRESAGRVGRKIYFSEEVLMILSICIQQYHVVVGFSSVVLHLGAEVFVFEVIVIVIWVRGCGREVFVFVYKW